ncbi:hypothetical protein [Lactococcus allomyrinae]|uniref:Uncharacterized protein n=1 Tax=Lactococcus allomyrinae TaxID=2419773 RepID=A0A387BJC2_9LACT|nr:hypothetical protein [Lactococcus allomyrinae]AYG01126.1 hypothetical protein D7I46_08485 [Lactococcus allomyrinae]
MLTDRQNKFYLEIQNLGSHLDEGPERTYLWQAWDDIRTGQDFKRTINQLCLNLRELEKYPAGLTQETKKLFEQLVSTYGEPVGELNKSIFSKNWGVVNSNPDAVFVGRGWTSRKSLEKQKKSSCLKSIMSAFIILVFGCVFLAVIWTPILPWIEGHVGNTIFYGGVITIIVIVILILILTGNVKKSKK